MRWLLPVAALMVACGPEPPPPGPPPGPLSHEHRVLGNKRHVILVTAEPGVAETDQQVVDRIRHASSELAGNICPDGFEMLHAPAFEGHWLEKLERRTESYVFACD